MTHANLRGLRVFEAGEHDLLFVGEAIAVIVFQIQDVRRCRDDEPSPPQHETVDEAQPRRELLPLFKPPVAVGILEQRDSSKRRPFPALDRIGIAAIFGHEEPAWSVEHEGHRIDHERLRGHQLDAQAGLELERTQCLFGRAGRIAPGLGRRRHPGSQHDERRDPGASEKKPTWRMVTNEH